jgi:hypothetical protein
VKILENNGLIERERERERLGECKKYKNRSGHLLKKEVDAWWSLLVILFVWSKNMHGKIRKKE